MLRICTDGLERTRRFYSLLQCVPRITNIHILRFYISFLILNFWLQITSGGVMVLLIVLRRFIHVADCV